MILVRLTSIAATTAAMLIMARPVIEGQARQIDDEK